MTNSHRLKPCLKGFAKVIAVCSTLGACSTVEKSLSDFYNSNSQSQPLTIVVFNTPKGMHISGLYQSIPTVEQLEKDTQYRGIKEGIRCENPEIYSLGGGELLQTYIVDCK